MARTVIKVENLYKEYKLGIINHGYLIRDLQSWWARARGKEDPNSLISEHYREGTEKGSFLALNDISFDVQKGDRLAIIGKNGAGKSTLLKILSRITSPTKGTAKIYGRVGSLLEVGTGFHPELTGRDNIFLNGSILGMTRHEITRKLDEIVAFAGIDKYLDTPVKRYSSGMMVRLGFAVAAHLDTDILIADEVLAVGDTEFQKKAIGKMQEVSEGEGRTILFVSHNMTAVKGLCRRGIWLKDGMLHRDGDVDDIARDYLLEDNEGIQSDIKLIDRTDYKGDGRLIVNKASIFSEGCENGNVMNTDKTQLSVQIYNKYRLTGDMEFAGKITDVNNTYIHYFASKLKSKVYRINGEEYFNLSAIFDSLPLVAGAYNVGLEIKFQGEIVYWIRDALQFSVIDNDFYSSGVEWKNGFVFLNQEWI